LPHCSRWSSLAFPILAGAVLASGASANTIDFLGIHQIVVHGAGGGATTETTFPFAASLTGSPSGGLTPSAEFAGQQPNPFAFHFSGSLENGAQAHTSSGGSFTLDQPTRVRIAGWAELLDGQAGQGGTDGTGPAEFDARVMLNGLYNSVMAFTQTSGLTTFDEAALLPPGFYTFSYGSNAPQLGDGAAYDFLLTIPEPTIVLLLLSGALIAAPLALRRRR
jgi:hypothetical protein